MYAVCIMHYAPDPALVDSVRPRHRTYIGPLLANETVVVAGSFEPPNTGAMFLYSVGEPPGVPCRAARTRELHRRGFVRPGGRRRIVPVRGAGPRRGRADHPDLASRMMSAESMPAAQNGGYLRARY
jgi:hypothetical protein